MRPHTDLPEKLFPSVTAGSYQNVFCLFDISPVFRWEIPAEPERLRSGLLSGSCFNKTARKQKPGFHRQYPHTGEFMVSNQPHIPSGLTIPPQADTACPTACGEFNTEKRRDVLIHRIVSQSTPYRRSEGHSFTERSTSLNSITDKIPDVITQKLHKEKKVNRK